VEHLVIFSGLLIRHRLNLLVAIPLTMVTLLVVPLVSGRVSQLRLADRTAQLAENARRVSNLIETIQSVRLLSVGYLDGGPVDMSALNIELAAMSDARAQLLRDVQDPDPAVVRAVRTAAVISDSGPEILARRLSDEEVIGMSSTTVTTLIDSLGLDRQHTVSSEDAWRLSGLLALLKSNEAASEAGAKLLVRACKPAVASAVEFDSSVAESRDRDYRAMFVRLASPSEDALFRQAAYGVAAERLKSAQAQVALIGTLAPRPELAPQVFSAVESQTALRQIVQATIAQQVARSARSTSRAALLTASLLIILAAALLALVLGLSVTIGRSVSTPLRRLSSAAGEVADVASQELANVADDDEGPDVVRRLPEIPVESRDELGELAAAFNRVHAATAQLLERQVAGRRNVAAMFASVGRRTGNLVGRQLAMIDTLESAEQDPRTLGTLYQLDHISTRLRRNASSLVVLSGNREAMADETAVVSLPDAVRAALGSVEDFQRVVLAPLPEVFLSPAVSADMVLILAELIENGVMFSPPHTAVELAAWVTDDGRYALTVVDHGIGMPPERLAEENARLRQRERLDLAPSDVLGLFVVGRVSRRHGIEVTLIPTPGGGLTCRVALPPSLFVGNPWSSAALPESAPDQQAEPVEADVSLAPGPSAQASAVAGTATPQPAAPEPLGAEQAVGQQPAQGSGAAQPGVASRPEGHESRPEGHEFRPEGHEASQGLRRRVPGTHWEGPLPVAPTSVGEQVPASPVAVIRDGGLPALGHEEAPRPPDPEATRRQVQDLESALAGLELPSPTGEVPPQGHSLFEGPRPVDDAVAVDGGTGPERTPHLEDGWVDYSTGDDVPAPELRGTPQSSTGCVPPDEPRDAADLHRAGDLPGPGPAPQPQPQPEPASEFPSWTESPQAGGGRVMGAAAPHPGAELPLRQQASERLGAAPPGGGLVRRVPGATLAALGVAMPEGTGPAASPPERVEIDPDETLQAILEVDEAVRRARAQGSPTDGGWATDDAVSRWGSRMEGGGR
jgi:signal transduction histidine kinase